VERGTFVRILDINLPADHYPGTEAVQADVRDAEAVLAACEGIDVVFHNAAQVAMAKDKNLFWSVNRDGTRNLLESCARRAVKKVVYTSSSAVYGAPRSNPVTEETVPTPMEEYGRAKLAGESLCREYELKGLDVSIVRPCTILGHGRLGIFQILFEWIYQGRNIPVLDGGKNIYQFVHAGDFAEACIRASALMGADAFNCGTDRFGTMREALEHLCRHAGTGSKVKSLPMRPIAAAMKLCSALGISPLAAYHALMYGRSLYFDISKAQAKLGWVPRYSNDEMLVESYEWYLAHRPAVLAGAAAASRHRSAVEQGALKILQWFL
jgi:nucleoside-diphosphate-sugar epimerase